MDVYLIVLELTLTLQVNKKIFMLRAVLVTISLLLSSLLIADEAPLHTETPSEKETEPLDWKDPGTYKLPLSHSSLTLPENRLALIGNDAKKFSSQIGNYAGPMLEALTVDLDDYIVYFEYHDDGYISLNDWENVDAEQLIASIREETEEQNKDRRENGFSCVQVIGWNQEPTLDKTTNTVFWTVELKSDDNDEHYVNSVALKLGRNGYEKLIWAGRVSHDKPLERELDIILQGYSFDPGYRYSDHISGDKIATYGICSLIAATVGAKVAKATGLLLFFKKFWIFLVIGIAACFKKMKEAFYKKK